MKLKKAYEEAMEQKKTEEGWKKEIGIKEAQKEAFFLRSTNECLIKQ